MVGALRATNTWDFPTYLGLSVLTLALIGWRRVQRGESWPRAILFWVVSSLVRWCSAAACCSAVHAQLRHRLRRVRVLARQPHVGRRFSEDQRAVAVPAGQRGAADLPPRASRQQLGLALIGGGALALALATVLSGFVALVLLVPLAGAALGLFGPRWAASARVPARMQAHRGA